MRKGNNCKIYGISGVYEGHYRSGYKIRVSDNCVIYSKKKPVYEKNINTSLNNQDSNGVII